MLFRNYKDIMDKNLKINKMHYENYWKAYADVSCFLFFI